MKKSNKKIVSMCLIVLMMLSMIGTVAAQPEAVTARILNDKEDTKEGVVGRGTLYVEGKGKALMEGTGWVYLGGVGRMVVIGEDVTVYTNGYGKVTHIGKLITIYQGRGSAKVVGEDMVILIRARGKLAASGEGMAILRGTGDFEVDKWRAWTETFQPYELEGVELSKVE